LTKWKKAISAGMSAALLATLFTMTAGSVLAATTVTGAPSIPRGGTSATAPTFTFTENTAACFANAAGTLVYTITTAGVTFTGTPTLTAPGSLGATLTSTTTTFTVATTASDTTNIEQISVGALKLKATTAAALGAVTATLTGSLAACVVGTTTATGTLGTQVNVALTAGVTINVSSTCGFDNTATTTTNATFTTGGPDGRVLTAVTALAGGIQTATFGAGTTIHTIGQTVSQVVPACGNTLSPGTVVDVIVQDVPAGAATVQPGEFNQAVSNTTVTELTAGFLANPTVITFTLSQGAFSTSPIVWVSGGAGLLLSGATSAPCNLSFDRKSCSVTTSAVSTAAAQLTLGDAGNAVAPAGAQPVLVDIVAGAVIGSAVDIAVTTSPVVAVDVDASTVAYVARVVVGTAAQPTIYIGENDQPTGQISLTESAAGFFTDGTGSNNAFALCLRTGETFTRAPFAVVTVGNLLLLSGVVGSSSVLGTLYSESTTGNSCARWTVYTVSTTASTIEIRGSDSAGAVLPTGANNGPRLSVPNSLAPGATVSDILIGSQAQILAGTGLSSKVSNATRAFRNQPLVVAVNQPVIAKGATHASLGNITITETQAGQFKATEDIELCILSLATPAGNNAVATFTSGNTADNPAVATNTASGLLAHVLASSIGGNCFDVIVDQQASGTLGVITISNMIVSVLGDAPNTNLLVEVESFTAGVKIFQTVSPARIGSAVAGTTTSRLGVTKVGSFTTSTKVQVKGKYVTFRFDLGISAAGAHVEIWGATKTGNDWSGFSRVTSRIANASGVVYYYIRQNSATWKSYRAYWPSGGVWTPARQARWR